ncbi:hypothetical protein BJ912DRAFT_1058887 [Pholiota molesta]|nr:hypothetical protein BJ912DRAFT_1058887 [Pholiota molesta]
MPSRERWLKPGRQEAVHQRCLYLQWAVPGYTAEIMREEGGATANEEQGEEEEGAADDATQGVVEEPQQHHVYRVAKKPAIVGASPTSIATDFNAADFLVIFNRFLASYLPGCTARGSDRTVFSIYKRIVLYLPTLREVSMDSDLPAQDVVYATKAVARSVTSRGIKHAVAAKASTVLIRVAEAAEGEGPLSGLCVAQVHVIFKLPDEFGTFPCPLAYVSWFKPLRHPVPGIGMYQVSFSSQNHRRRASIIPITDIVRTCHLIPVFGSASAQDLGWTAEKVVSEAPSFYLNPYLRHHDFVLLRHQVDLHLDEQAARERSIEERRARGIRPRHPYVMGR